MTNLKVFVYGTLKPGEMNYPVYCEGNVLEFARAYVLGNLYHLAQRGYPGMTWGNRKIGGFLLTFTDETVLTKLDELEDYQPGRSPQENEYNRCKIPVYNPNNDLLGEAWGYIMSLDKVQELGGIHLPSGWWTGIS